jgi:hypothetical protein
VQLVTNITRKAIKLTEDLVSVHLFFFRPVASQFLDMLYQNGRLITREGGGAVRLGSRLSTTTKILATIPRIV